MMLRTMRTLVLVLVAMVAATPARSAEVDKYLPNDSEIVINFNVRQVLESKLMTKYGLETLKELLDANDEAKSILKALDFDPFKDITKLTIAAAPVGATSDKGLFIVHGKFDIAKFEKKLEEHAKEHKDELKIHKHGDTKIYEIDMPGEESAKTSWMALIDKETIVASPNKEYVVEALEKRAGKKEAKHKKELKDLIENASSDLSFWGVALSEALNKGLPGEDNVRQVLGKFDSVSFGVNVTDEIRLQLVLAAKSEKLAEELAKDMAEFLDHAKTMVAGLPINNNQDILDFIGSLKSQQKGKDVTLKGRISSDLIEKSIPK